MAWRIADPQSQESLWALYWIYERQERYADELKVLQNISPRTEWVELQTGMAQIHAGDIVAGAKTLKSALEASQDQIMWNSLAGGARGSWSRD